jgi:hypothetical protein
MSDVFTHPIMYWVGMDLAECTPTELEQFRRHYADVHRVEVVERNPGFVTSQQYELAEPDPRGKPGPRWLTIYEIDGEQSLADYLERHESPGAKAMGWTPGPAVWADKRSTVWRMMWRRQVTVGAPSPEPDTLRVIGMDPAPSSDAAALAEFDAFYTDVHVPEVMGSTPFDHAARYERAPEFHARPADTPRFCALYEGGADKTEELAAIRAQRSEQAAPRRSGPAAWAGRDTKWRLTYRRVA